MRQMQNSARPRLPDQYLEVDGARLRYRDEGHGPALILIHGWMLDLDMWEAQAAALSDAYRVIRLDRRGFGLSSGLPSPARDVDDLAALCRRLKLQRIALLGMSQGARVALRFAISSPDLVACLILDGPPSLDAAHCANDAQANDAAELPYQHYRALAQSQGVAAFRREWAGHPLVTLRTRDPAARELLARMIERAPGRDLTDAPPSPGFAATRQMIESIRAPVLLIGGALDLDSRQRFADRLMPQFLNVQRAHIPDAGHLCSLDNPAAYTATLRQFLDRHVPASTHP